MHILTPLLKKRTKTKRETQLSQVCFFFFSCEKHPVVLLPCMYAWTKKLKAIFLHLEKGKKGRVF